MDCRELEALWHREFPVAAAMRVKVDAWEGGRLCISAPLAHNHNIHGTGFAGSQYALAALCGWGAITLRMAELDLPGSILTTEGNITFATPVNGDLAIRCNLAPFEAEFETLASTGRATFALPCEISEVATPDTVCSRYTGTYPVRLRR